MAEVLSCVVWLAGEEDALAKEMLSTQGRRGRRGRCDACGLFDEGAVCEWEIRRRRSKAVFDAQSAKRVNVVNGCEERAIHSEFITCSIEVPTFAFTM